jgi:hypothetical protein
LVELDAELLTDVARLLDHPSRCHDELAAAEGSRAGHLRDVQM